MIIIPPRPGQTGQAQLKHAAAGAGLVLPDVAVLALQQGRLIEAIKLIRTANPGLDLARAKAVMEHLQAQAQSSPAPVARADVSVAEKAQQRMHAPRPPTVEMGDPPGQLRWLLVVVAMVAAAAWIGYGGVGLR
jgi:hypothetical protein